MTLYNAPLKTQLTITQINDKRVVTKHFKDLGLTKNSKIEVLNKAGSGIIVKSHGSIYGVDKNLANNIEVKS